MDVVFTDHFAQRVVERKVDMVALMPEIERNYLAGAWGGRAGTVYLGGHCLVGKVVMRRGVRKLLLITVAEPMRGSRRTRRAKNKQVRKQNQRLNMEDIATLVDVTLNKDWDVYVGRARKRNADKLDARLRYTHPFSAPYYRHNGNPNWREEAAEDYERHLRTKLQDREELYAFMGMEGMKIGVWGEFGMELGEVVLKLLREAKQYNTVKAP